MRENGGIRNSKKYNVLFGAANDIYPALHNSKTASNSFEIL